MMGTAGRENLEALNKSAIAGEHPGVGGWPWLCIRAPPGPPSTGTDVARIASVSVSPSPRGLFTWRMHRRVPVEETGRILLPPAALGCFSGA